MKKTMVIVIYSLHPAAGRVLCMLEELMMTHEVRLMGASSPAAICGSTMNASPPSRGL